jgi:hypothetical protein
MRHRRLADSGHPADFPYQEASTMTMICKWVHADDGALVMEWTKAEDMHVRRGPGGQQPPSTGGLAVRDARVLTPLGGGNNDHPLAAGVSRTADYPAGDEPAAIPGVTLIRERASR